MEKNMKYQLGLVAFCVLTLAEAKDNLERIVSEMRLEMSKMNVGRI